MAAFPLCASWFAPAAVAAVASHGARPTSTAVHVHPLCRRGTSPAPVRIHDRTRVPFPSRCHRRPTREPEPESDDDVLYLDQLDLRASIDNPYPTEDEEQRKKYAEFCASMGWREPPDMFPIERDEISNYMIRTASSRANDQDVNNKVMVLVVCAEAQKAQKALDLASRVILRGRSYEYGKIKHWYS
nr:unnamed protein product [Digitaria exilis]